MDINVTKECLSTRAGWLYGHCKACAVVAQSRHGAIAAHTECESTSLHVHTPTAAPHMDNMLQLLP